MTTNQQINNIANILFGLTGGTAANIAAPANYYIGLLTATPNPDGTNTVEVSTVGTGYARQILPNNKTALTMSNNGQVSNVSDLNFPTATASWGSVTDVGIFDSLTGGNLLYFSHQAVPKAFDTGDVAYFSNGDVLWSLQNIA